MEIVIKLFALAGIVWILQESKKKETGGDSSSAAKWYPMVPDMSIRSCDGDGCGFFGASRGDRLHNGIDIVAYPNAPIYSPIDGVVSRAAIPYTNDHRFSGVEIVGNGHYEGYKLKVFYLTPIQIGMGVFRADLLGYAQDIRLKYGDDITPHVHIEVSFNGTTIDPTFLF